MTNRTSSRARSERQRRKAAPRPRRRTRSILTRPRPSSGEAPQARLSRRVPAPEARKGRSRRARQRLCSRPVIDALKEIFDPEIPVNIYDLGLIYGVEVDDECRCDRHHDADHAALPRGRNRCRARSNCASPRSRGFAMPRSIWSGTRHGARTRCPTKPGSNWECYDERDHHHDRMRPAAVNLTHGAEARIAELMAQRARRRDRREALDPAPRVLGPRLFGRLRDRGEPSSTRRSKRRAAPSTSTALACSISSVRRWTGVEDDFTAGFVFENPNAKGACGCGESFMV